MVRTMLRRRAAAILLLVGVAAGAAGAQAVEALLTVHYVATGLFTLRDRETVEFNVSLDDVPSAPDSTVTMRLYDDAGAVVARRTVTLGAGQSATLRHQGTGRYRAWAQVTDPTGIVSDRRVAATTVEIGHIDDLIAPRFVCGPGDHIFVPHK